MNAHDVERSSTTAGLPISPGLGPTLEQAHILKHPNVLDNRTLFIVGLSVVLALATTVVARALIFLIGLITNLAFYARLSGELSSPSNNTLGYWVILVPVIGAGIVGVMARYGSKAIRGHGIPEAMEQVLLNESRIPLRMTFLKPLSAAIAIGTGGPFGAEGPIIGTGGALGSLLGQLIHVTAHERKTLLAAGAAAGMTAIFGTPFSAILLAIELLLFEFRPRSFIPVAFAALTANVCIPYCLAPRPCFMFRTWRRQAKARFWPILWRELCWGCARSSSRNRSTMLKTCLSICRFTGCGGPHWGELVVGVIGVYSPHTMGIGYENIEQILSGKFVGPTLMAFCAFKFISWSVALGSGTSGGTLAPLFTIGGGIGVLTGQLLNIVAPSMGLDLRMAALVGMASCFAGASRAMLASVVFALEITQQFNSLLPLLAGCTAAFTVSALLMKNTIMTEKLVRRGHHVPSEYLAHDTRS